MSNQAIIAGMEAIDDAVHLLEQGQLVAFPTETVYGLGADARNPEAVSRIFQAKQRPANHPLIVHLADTLQLEHWASSIPPLALQLAEHFWPGPLALILPKHPAVPLAVTGGQQTIGLRIPDNPVALELLRRFGSGIAAPSANLFNHVSPTRAAHVQAELGDRIAMILDGGDCRVGLESTIVDLTGEQPVILRPGHITPTQLSDVAGQPITLAQRLTTRAPGTLALHYSPTTPSLLCTRQQLSEILKNSLAQHETVGLLCWQRDVDYPASVKRMQLADQPDEYGHALYAALRQLDALQLDKILIEAVPDNEDWQAINDRLQKATAGTP